MGTTIAVIAGGAIKNYGAVAKEIQTFPVICADSGYRHCVAMGIVPDLLVGDFDSIGDYPKSLPVRALPVDKDYTDSVFAVEEAKRRQPNTILLYGMLGGRVDHSFSNIALLADTAKEGYSVILSDGITTITPLVPTPGETRTSYTFSPLAEHYFSVVSYTEHTTHVTIEGGKYPLDDYLLTSDKARAISNEFIGQPVTLRFGEGLLFFITTPLDH